MSSFLPEENTMICMYGPPPFSEGPTFEEEIHTQFTQEESFFEKVAAFFKRIFDFIKGLFTKN